MSNSSTTPDQGRRWRWLWVVPVLAIAALVWSLRPGPTTSGAGGQEESGRPVLIDASASGAAVLHPAGTGQPSLSVTGWSADGRKTWSSSALADRLLIVCDLGCRTGYGSASLTSSEDPELADPPVLSVGPTGEQLGPTPEGRERVLWAGAGAERITATSASRSGPFRITWTDGQRTRPLTRDHAGDALVLADGDRAVLLTHPSDDAAAVFLRHDQDGWHPLGKPVRLKSFSGGCFAVTTGRPQALVYDQAQSVLVSPKGAKALPGGAGIGQCTFDATGPVVASYGLNGAGTRISQRTPQGTDVWSKDLPGTLELSGRPEHQQVVAADREAGQVTFLGADGAAARSVPGVAAKVLEHDLVILDLQGVPHWQPLP